MVDIDKAISIAVKTGKVVFGANSAIKNAQSGKAKLIVIAANCPHKIRSDIEYYSKLSGLPVVVFGGTSIDLGMTCGKPYMVATLSIKEPGDSDILKLVEKPSIEEELEEEPYETEEEETAEAAEEAAEVEEGESRDEEDYGESAAEDEEEFEGEDVDE
jgi:large subunit ribosomal protein L30e